MKEEICAHLTGLGIPYTRLDHPKADTMEACAAIEVELGAPICKNLLLTNRQQTRFYLLMMPGNKPFFTKDLSKQLGTARLSFASAAQMEELLGVAPGSASVLCLANDTEQRVQLVMDAPVMDGALVGCHPCDNTSTLSLRMKDLLEVFLPATGHTPIRVEL